MAASTVPLFVAARIMMDWPRESRSRLWFSSQSQWHQGNLCGTWIVKQLFQVFFKSWSKEKRDRDAKRCANIERQAKSPQNLWTESRKDRGRRKIGWAQIFRSWDRRGGQTLGKEKFIHSIPVATTGQHVQWWECSGVVGSQWSQQQHESVVKGVDGSRPISGSRHGHRGTEPVDERRIEILADGLPSFHGTQIAVNTTLVSVLRRDGAFRTRCADVDGAALEAARRTKERRYPELSPTRPNTLGGLGSGSGS